MSKLYRSLLWSGLVVAGVAACGDDVTVAPPPPPPAPAVHSVSVAPNPGSILPGGTLQMIATVNADAGVATTVAWTSSNAAVVSVNPTSGLATAIAAAVPGTSVAITACSTVAGFTGVCNSASVVVASGATVTSVTVTPGPNVSFVVGQAPVTFVAAVIGTGSPSQAVTWSTADGSTSVVTVGATTGIVTIVGAGSVVVKACANAAPTVCGSSAITVQVAAPTQISIQGITQGGTTTPVLLSNVSGQVDVVLNVDPGAGSLVKVQVLIGGVVAAEQCFIATCPVSLRVETNPANAVQTVVLSLNTRQVRKLTNGLYIPVAFNGPQAFSAKLFTSLTTAGLSSNVIPVVLQNADAWVTGTTPVLTPASTSPSAAGTVSSGGATWYRSDVNFVGGANYVSFFPVTPEITFDSNICGTSNDAVVGTPQTGISFAGTFTCGGGAEGAVEIDNPVGDVTAGTPPAADVIYIGADTEDTEQVGTVYTVNGDPRYNLLDNGSLNSGNSVFVDFVAPSISADEIGFVDGCSLVVGFPVPGCWVNGSYDLTDDFVTSDAGSNSVTENVFNYVSTVLGIDNCGTTAFNLATLPEDPSSTKYDACVVATDAIGNSSTARGNNVFGLDRHVPTIVYTGGYASDSTVVNVIPAATINYSVNDDNSGLDDNALTLILTTLIADAAPSCTSGSIPATLAPGAPNTPRPMLVPIPSPDNACGDQGYYTWTASVHDRAGNFASPAPPNEPVVFALDRTAPEIQAVAPQPLYAANQNANFLVFATDSTDLAGVRIEVRYQATCSGVACTSPVNLGYTITSGFGTVWDNVLTTITTPPTGFPAVIPGTQVFGSFVIDTTVTLGGPDSVLTQADITAFDFFPNSSAVANLLIPAVYKDPLGFPAAGSANPWATTGIFAGATFSGSGACTYTYDTPSNGPTIPTRVLVANQIAVGPPLVLDILSEIVTTGTGLGASDNPKLISDNGTFRRYQYLVDGGTCAALQGAGTLRLIAVKGTGPGLSAYLVP